jgi:hypothetical protein
MKDCDEWIEINRWQLEEELLWSAPATLDAPLAQGLWTLIETWRRARMLGGIDDMVAAFNAVDGAYLNAIHFLNRRRLGNEPE